MLNIIIGFITTKNDTIFSFNKMKLEFPKSFCLLYIMTWIDDVDDTLKPYLKALIKDSHFNKKSFSNASNPGNAQLWIVLATLYKQIVTLDNKIKLLEKTLREINKEK